MNRPAFKKTAVSFKKMTPKKVSVAAENLVSTDFLKEGLTTPLVLSPTSKDLDAPVWLKQNRDFLDAKLHQHGAILFRGFDIPHETAFQDFAAYLTDALYGDYGDLPKKQENVYGVTPYPPDKVILFHSESSHLHRWPMRQFFYCKTPAAAGGETPIVDNRALLQAMDPALVEQFKQRGLRYVRNFIRNVDVSWQDFFKTESRGEVDRYCAANAIETRWKDNGDLTIYHQSPAVLTHPRTGEAVFFNQIQLHHIAFLDAATRETLLRMLPMEDLPRNVYWGDGEPLDDDMVRELERLTWEHSVDYPWRHGDLLMVDNMLVAHARRTYEAPREMFVAMGDMIDLADLNTEQER